jgi:hypothetical protein
MRLAMGQAAVDSRPATVVKSIFNIGTPCVALDTLEPP